jgi:hypothetical protein
VTLFRLLLAAVAVTAWFIAWQFAASKLRPDARPLRPLIDGSEAAGLTLFAALWFGSLGHGGWYVLFAVIGLLIEGPARARHRADLPTGPLPWRAALLGTLRILGAGAILSFLL